MKHKILKLFVRCVAIVGLLASAFVRADVPITTITQGGVTCGEFARGAGFPATYWDCITPTTGGSGQPEFVVANTASALPVNLKAGLQAANTQLFVFATSAAYTSFTGAASASSLMGDIASISVKGSQAKVAAIFATATIGNLPTNLKPYYAGIARFQLGRIYGTYVAVAPLKPTDPFFTAAVQDDLLYLNANKGDASQPNYPSRVEVWGATIAAQYPGKSPWQVLGERYGNDNSYIYGMQWAEQDATPLPTDLHTTLNGFMQTTKKWTSQQFFGAVRQSYVVNGNVLCVETGVTLPWPHTWWNCVRPYTPTIQMDDVFTAAQTQIPGTVTANWKLLLHNADVKLYAFRDVSYYEDFTGVAPPKYSNVYGISQYGGQPLSAAFQDAYTDENMVWRINVSQYTAGTIVHELGHELDKVVWSHISSANSAGVLGSIRFRQAVLDDKAAYNKAGTCVQVVDADRIASGLSPICDKYPVGTSNWDVMTLANYGYKDSDPNGTNVALIYEELWAQAFARRAGGTFPTYASTLQNRMSNQHVYMNDLWLKGAPHN